MIEILTKEDAEKKLGRYLPNPPIPQSFNDLPPECSPKIELARNTRDKFNLLWDADDSDTRVWWPDPTPGNTINLGSQPNYTVTEYWGSHPEYNIVLLEWWQRLDYQQLPPSGSFSENISITSGIDVSTTETATREIGASIGDVASLSASLSETFSTTVSVTSSTTVEKSWSYTSPNDKQSVWVLWQLVQGYFPVDATGNIVNWPRDTYTARMKFVPIGDGIDGSLLLWQSGFINPMNVYHNQAYEFDAPPQSQR